MRNLTLKITIAFLLLVIGIFSIATVFAQSLGGGEEQGVQENSSGEEGEHPLARLFAHFVEQEIISREQAEIMLPEIAHVVERMMREGRHQQSHEMIRAFHNGTHNLLENLHQGIHQHIDHPELEP
jgi:hypothetical protein